MTADDPQGVLSDTGLRALIAAGAILPERPVTDAQIQPASIDLRLGSVAYRVRASFLAGPGRKVADRIAEFEMHRISLSDGAVLEKGCVYLVPLQESLALPSGLSAVANAKSSTGRLDLLTRTITDGGVEFDRIPDGYRGPLYAEICPRSFSVLARTGQRLNQLRVRRGSAALNDADLHALHAETPLVSGSPVISDGLGFSVDLRPASGDLVGYRAKPHTGVDRSRPHRPLRGAGLLGGAAHHRRPHHPRPRRLLYPGQPRGGARSPPPTQPKWPPTLPWSANSGCITRASSTPASAGQRQVGPDRAACSRCAATKRPSCWNTGRSWGGWSMSGCPRCPARIYGADLASNYQGQGLKLSKHFRVG